MILSPDVTTPIGLFLKRKSDGSSQVIQGGTQFQAGWGQTITHNNGIWAVPSVYAATSVAGTYKASVLISSDMFNWEAVEFDETIATTTRIGCNAVWIANGNRVVLEMATGETWIGDLVLS